MPKSKPTSKPKPKPKIWTKNAFKIKTSTIEGAGKGLFAKQRIEIEDTIGYYTGYIIDEVEFNNPDRPFSPYVMWVSSKHIIVGEGPEANYTRYINHSEEPNAFLITSTRWKTARIEAISTIEPGEEIFFNYGDDYWEAEEESC